MEKMLISLELYYTIEQLLDVHATLGDYECKVALEKLNSTEYLSDWLAEKGLKLL